MRRVGMTRGVPAILGTRAISRGYGTQFSRTEGSGLPSGAWKLGPERVSVNGILADSLSSRETSGWPLPFRSLPGLGFLPGPSSAGGRINDLSRPAAQVFFKCLLPRWLGASCGQYQGSENTGISRSRARRWRRAFQRSRMMDRMRSGHRLFAALLAAGLFAAAIPRARAAREPRPACGAPGKPACPLQHWMRTRIAAPLATHDLAMLAAGLDELAKLNPEPHNWGNWTRYAREAASAARSGKTPLLACVNCHKVYRAEYNAKYRQRAISHLPAR